MSTYSEWFAGKSFSTDWTSRYFPIWASLLASRREDPLNILEIGSWEGRSTIFFLRYLKNSKITCIDTFAGSTEHNLRPKWSVELPHIEKRFDSNLEEFCGRVTKLKNSSYRALAALNCERAHFDIAYIDGSHHSADVRADAILCWPLMRPGGIIIFDDYEWTLLPEEIDRPKLGVDAFLSVHQGQYRELHRSYQLIIEKRDSPSCSLLRGILSHIPDAFIRR